jgi:hypothetical protein
MSDAEYIRHTCLLHAAATLNSSGQFHCGEQCKDLDDLFQQIERETGWNSNRPSRVLKTLWDHYKETR